MDIAARLRDEGHRATRPRQAVWSALTESGAHLTAEEVHARVRESSPEVNLASVYRALALLDEIGVVERIQMAEGGARWEVAHAEQSVHLHCRSCDRVDHHPADGVEAVVEHLGGGHGFTVEELDLVVRGRCADCAARG